jgi:hypothetical protein
MERRVDLRMDIMHNRYRYLLLSYLTSSQLLHKSPFIDGNQIIVLHSCILGKRVASDLLLSRKPMHYPRWLATMNESES